MIVGNGLLAKAFARYFAEDQRVLVFAAGVSNSGETREDAFARERALLSSVIRPEVITIYFSTCSMADGEKRDTPYIRHKKRLEETVGAMPRHVIIRLPQLVGKTSNPFTLTNYLCRRIAGGEPFQIWRNARRHVMDVEDAAAIVAHMIRTGRAEGRTLNVAPPHSIALTDLVGLLEQILHKRANATIVDRGASYSIDSSAALAVAKELGICFDEDYVACLLRKYYAPERPRLDSQQDMAPCRSIDGDVCDRHFAQALREPNHGGRCRKGQTT